MLLTRRPVSALLILALASIAAVSPAIASASTSKASRRVSVSQLTLGTSSFSVFGGTEKVSARVANARSCELTITPSVQGFPKKVRCRRGTVHFTADLPANKSDAALSYRFTVRVVSGRRSAVKHSTAAVATAPHLAIGHKFGCALLPTGHVKCWGGNEYNQLGDNGVEWEDSALEVSGISNAVEISAGEESTCALLENHHVKCWGSNYSGELGFGGETGKAGDEYKVPEEVAGVVNATQVSVGGYHACAVLSDNSVKCWGWDRYGEVDRGTPRPEFVATPEAALNTGSVERLASDTLGGYGSCAILTSHEGECWGFGLFGEMGSGLSEEITEPPQKISGLTGIKQLSGLNDANCALIADGKVDCWGDGSSGELGNGKAEQKTTPVGVDGISGATEIAANENTACALVAGGKVDCWGYNLRDQLGNKTAEESQLTPVEVEGISGATQIGNGGDAVCAILSTGKVECWGYNSLPGKLGNSEVKAPGLSITPVVVQGL